MINETMETNIFEPKIKDKNCKHEWERMRTKMKRSSFLIGTYEVEYDYFFCTKCESVTGDIIRM